MDQHLSIEKVKTLIHEALKEDIGSIDLTTTYCVPVNFQVEADLIVKEGGIIAGLPVAELVFNLMDKDIRFRSAAKDSQQVFEGKTVAYISGPARPILTAERLALNFLSHLSGIATLTRQFVEKVKGFDVKIRDTRKTTPILRDLEKYAVRMGGGYNHRMGLNDQVLIKDNHLRCERIAMDREKIRGKSEIEMSINKVRSNAQHNTIIEVEVETLQQLREALKCKTDMILLDNMSPSDAQEAVKIRNALDKAKSILLEVSGGVTLDNVRDYAATGVEYISVGALTHSAKALNVSLEVMK